MGLENDGAALDAAERSAVTPATNDEDVPIHILLQVDDGARWLRLTSPTRVLAAHTPDAVASVLRDVDELTRSSTYHAAGFLTYEAGAAYGLATHAGDSGLPLAWFGLFDDAHVEEVGP